MEDRGIANLAAESQESLAKLLELLSSGADLFEEKVGEMDGVVEACQQSLTAANEALEAFAGVMDASSQQVEGASTAAEGAYTSLNTAAAEGAKRVETAQGKVEESAKAALEALDQEKETLESENADAAEQVNECAAVLGGRSGELAEVRSDMAETFSDLHEHYENYASTFEVKLSELEGDYDQVSGTFSEDVMRILGAAMGAVAGPIVTGSAEDLGEKMTGLDENLTRQFGDFDTLVERTGDAIAEELKIMVEEPFWGRNEGRADDWDQDTSSDPHVGLARNNRLRRRGKRTADRQRRQGLHPRRNTGLYLHVRGQRKPGMQRSRQRLGHLHLHQDRQRRQAGHRPIEGGRGNRGILLGDLQWTRRCLLLDPTNLHEEVHGTLRLRMRLGHIDQRHCEWKMQGILLQRLLLQIVRDERRMQHEQPSLCSRQHNFPAWILHTL